MLKFFVLRFILRLLAFVGLILPATFAMALLMAPPAPAQPLDQGCDRNLASASASVAALQARVKGAAQGPEVCNATRLYFLEVVKARAVTAVCKTGPDRDRELVRLDADVQSINEAIAARCS
ncbi:MAG: hypothetical protein ABI830_02770 [Pseudolabrys sp.]